MSDRDRELSRIYAEAKGDQPPAHLDAAILAASRRAVGARPQARPRSVRRWAVPVALAATVVMTATVSLLVFEQRSQMETMEFAPPPTPQKAPEAKPAEKPSAAPATRADEAARGAAPQRPAPLRDRAENAVQAQPGFVPDAPPEQKSESKFERRDQAAPAQPSLEQRGAPAEDGRFREAQPPQAAARSQAGAGLRSAPPSPQLQPGGAVSAGQLSRDSGSSELKPAEWVEIIRKLKVQGRTAEAERELAEFKRRFPDYKLPDDLLQP